MEPSGASTYNCCDACSTSCGSNCSVDNALFNFGLLNVLELDLRSTRATMTTASEYFLFDTARNQGLAVAAEVMQMEKTGQCWTSGEESCCSVVACDLNRPSGRPRRLPNPRHYVSRVFNLDPPCLFLRISTQFSNRILRRGTHASDATRLFCSPHPWRRPP